MRKTFFLLFGICLIMTQSGNAGQSSTIMDSLPNTSESYNVYLSLGDESAAQENPEKALDYYGIVYHAAKKSDNSLFMRIALFKIARMQLWLNKYGEAIKSYQSLRSMHLSDSDAAIANAGLKKAYDLKLEFALQEAPKLIELNKGKQAYALIKDQLNRENSFDLYILAAKSMSMTDNPKKALYYFQRARQFSHTTMDKKIALFGIAKMQFWLGQYVRAKDTYQLLLSYQLNPIEHELALAGVVKSLAYYNRPRLALSMIPKQFVFTTPELLIAASQASLWSNWADITKCGLIKYNNIVQAINLNAAVGKDYQDLQWQTKLVTHPDVLTPTVFYSHDSEDFDKKRAIVDYTHYWSQLSQTSAGLDYIRYTEYTSDRLDARGFYVKQTLRPTRNIILTGQVEPIDYKNMTQFERGSWSPFLWNANVAYMPNDYVSLQAVTSREIIETFPAFNDRIIGSLYGASLTLNPIPYVQLNGALSKFNISDSNSKRAYYVSSSVLVLPNYGLTATGLFREYTDQFTSPDYFSPYNYKTGLILLKLSRKLRATWHYYLDGGIGRQYIISEPGAATAGSPTYQWGVGITGPLSKCLVLNAYYADTHQPSSFLGSSTYHYQYGAISINLEM